MRNRMRSHECERCTQECLRHKLFWEGPMLPFKRILFPVDFSEHCVGAATAKVLHDADCPVWTGVHLEQAPSLEKIEFRKLLCAVAIGPHMDTVLRCAVELANEYRASLSVLHVIQNSESLESARSRMS